MTRRSDTRVVALCGSLRQESKTRRCLTAVLAAAEEAGAETELVDLRAHELPALYATDSTVPAARTLRETVAGADCVVLGTPNYHGSYSGALKNALDHCGREEFEGTTVGLVEVAGGEFPGAALSHLRGVSRTLRAWTLPRELAVPNSHATVTDAGIEDPDLAGRARRLGRDLVSFAGVERYPAVVGTRSERERR